MNLKQLNQIAKEQCAEPDLVEIVIDGTKGYCTPVIEIVTALISDEGLISRDEGQEETPVNCRRKVILIS